MSNREEHIELKHYKILLLQIANQLIQKVCDTGLKPDSKREHLASIIEYNCSQLEREFKRDTTLKQSADAKTALCTHLMEGGIPEWLLHVLFNSMTEEKHKLARSA